MLWSKGSQRWLGCESTVFVNGIGVLMNEFWECPRTLHCWRTSLVQLGGIFFYEPESAWPSDAETSYLEPLRLKLWEFLLYISHLSRGTLLQQLIHSIHVRSKHYHKQPRQAVPGFPFWDGQFLLRPLSPSSLSAFVLRLAGPLSLGHIFFANNLRQDWHTVSFKVPRINYFLLELNQFDESCLTLHEPNGHKVLKVNFGVHNHQERTYQWQIGDRWAGICTSLSSIYVDNSALCTN